jgi:hypothetical protein
VIELWEASSPSSSSTCGITAPATSALGLGEDLTGERERGDPGQGVQDADGGWRGRLQRVVGERERLQDRACPRLRQTDCDGRLRRPTPFSSEAQLCQHRRRVIAPGCARRTTRGDEVTVSG